MFTPPAFRLDGDVIRIVNGWSRARSVGLILAAVFLVVLPYVPLEYLNYIRDADDTSHPNLTLCLFGAFCCLSAAFWWSEATIDPTTDQVRVVRRWGLSRSTFRRKLSSFHSIVLTVGDDGEVEVYLKGEGSDLGISCNHSRAIVWGRSHYESWLIASLLAQHLRLRLDLTASPTAV